MAQLELATTSSPRYGRGSPTSARIKEKFSREREAYCSATMAKVRAALGEHSETPRLGK